MLPSRMWVSCVQVTRIPDTPTPIFWWLPMAWAAMPQVKSGKLRLLGVTSGQPSALVPDAPTLASAGLPGYASELIVAVFGDRKSTRLNSSH